MASTPPIPASDPAATHPLRGDEMARHIARTAARLFAARGFDATSVREIVEAAGVTKPTLYYHFGSKEKLAEALVMVPLGGLVARLREIVGGAASPLEKLEAIAEAHFSFNREDPDRMRFLFGLAFAPVGTGLSVEINEFGERMHRIGEELMGVERAVVDELARDGVIAPDRAVDCAKAFHGLMMVHLIGFLFKCQELKPDQAHRMVTHLIWGFAGDRRKDSRSHDSRIP